MTAARNLPAGCIVSVARAAGQMVRQMRGRSREYVTRCPWAEHHNNGDEH
jgi:hypothetical protein